MPDPPTTVLRLWPTARAPGQARAALRKACSDLPSSVVSDASLLVTELVTNACQHARTTVTVAITSDDGSIGVAVHDSDATLPTTNEPESRRPEDEGGRGLIIARGIASRFGIPAAARGRRRQRPHHRPRHRFALRHPRGGRRQNLLVPGPVTRRVGRRPAVG